jgi:hypothetical protein
LGSEYQYSNGLSLYFPWSYLSYRKTLPRYLEHQFAAQDFMDSNWLESQFYRFTRTHNDKDKIKEEIKTDLKVIHEHRFTPNFWTIFLEYYLFSTLRNVRSGNETPYYLYSPEGESLQSDIRNDPRFRLNPLNKIWDDYDKQSSQPINLRRRNFSLNEDSKFESYKNPLIPIAVLSEHTEIASDKYATWADEKWNDEKWLDESKWAENENWFIDHERWSKVDKWSSKDDKWSFNNRKWTEISEADKVDNWSEDEDKWSSKDDKWFNNEKWSSKDDKWSKVDKWTAKVDKWSSRDDKWSSRDDRWSSRDDRWSEERMSEFGKTNNFPWAARFWQPSGNVINLWNSDKPSKNVKGSSVSEAEKDKPETT